MTENEVAKQVVDVSYKIHTGFGPGLLESVYETIMAYELQKRGLQVIRQQPIPVVYEDIRMELGFRADLIIENRVVVEVKSVEAIAPVHKKQLLTYLHLTDKRLGLLINFNVDLIKDGITRVVNGLQEGPHAKAQRR
ncbi:MAG: GxxExxY protein [Acidobacteria bacterium]|nr:MAG: GxxExxY protein [Acidobacteriota bacterium]